MLRADGGPQTPSPRGWPPEGTKQYNLTAVRAAASRLWGAVPSRRRPCRAVATVGRRAVPWVLPPVSSLSHRALHSLGGRRRRGSFPDTGVASHESYRSRKLLRSRLRPEGKGRHSQMGVIGSGTEATGKGARPPRSPLRQGPSPFLFYSDRPVLGTQHLWRITC